jgi:hypothetical protein
MGRLSGFVVARGGFSPTLQQASGWHWQVRDGTYCTDLARAGRSKREEVNEEWVGDGEFGGHGPIPYLPRSYGPKYRYLVQ